MGKLSRMRFAQLRLLVEMERTGSIRRAAAQLNMTQPAISKALKEVEAILDARLYERSVQGVRATAAGQAAARGAKLLLAELGMVASEIRQAGSADRLSIRIGITPYLGASVLPAALGRLTRKDQLGHILIEEGWASPLLDKLSEGALDMLLIMCTTEMVPALENASLRYERLLPEELAVVATPSHPLATRRRVRIVDLAEERWILGVPPSLTRRTLEEAFLHDGHRPPRPVFEATHLDNLVEAAAAGIGIAACPARGADNAIRAGRVIRLALYPAVALPPIVMVYRKLLSEHPRFAALAEGLRQEFSHGRSPAIR